jgi:hypothetical protein
MEEVSLSARERFEGDPATSREVRVPGLRMDDGFERLRLASWQDRILPFLLVMLGGITVFFLVATLVQLNSLQRSIQSPPVLDLASALAPLADSQSSSDRLLSAQWQTLARLEQYALERRYHQANVLLMARTWTRYLGFLTGMILTLVGAAFILGKLREEASSIALTSAPVVANLSTTSPGLALSVLGTVLMLATLLVHGEIETRDANPLYTRMILTPQGADAAPQPFPGGALVDPLTGESIPEAATGIPLATPGPTSFEPPGSGSQD